jgi:hypothetical protein
LKWLDLPYHKCTPVFNPEFFSVICTFILTARFFVARETIDRVINGYTASYTKNFMRNNLIFQKNSIYLALTLTLASVFMIFNFQTSYSQIPEVSYLDVNDTSSVSKFSAAAWFKTSANYDSDAYIVNKAGSSNNLNYGIWMTSAEKLRGGFETSGGSPMYATSPQSYNDGKWHYATVTYDGSDIFLYVDGVQVATKKTSGSPDRGDEPVRVGADSTELGDYFIGDVDEIRVWTVALTPIQVNDAWHDNPDTKYQELYLDFSEPIEMLNMTAVSLNQTALNQTALNQTALNQTDIVEVNDTSTSNDTSTQVNGTLPNQTGVIIQPSSIENDTGIDNETSTNLPPVPETPNVNDTGITNETQDNQSSTPPPEENNSPEAFDQSISVDTDGQADITLRAEDKDNDQLKFDITADPVQGTLTNFDGEKGTATYVPQQGYSGSDQFSFRAIDDKGSESNVAQVDITVEESQSNETQASDLTVTEPPKEDTTSETTNETSSEQSTGAGAVEQTNQAPNANGGNDISVCRGKHSSKTRWRSEF